jgi:hypothetical protein
MVKIMEKMNPFAKWLTLNRFGARIKSKHYTLRLGGSLVTVNS